MRERFMLHQYLVLREKNELTQLNTNISVLDTQDVYNGIFCMLARKPHLCSTLHLCGLLPY